MAHFVVSPADKTQSLVHVEVITDTDYSVIERWSGCLPNISCVEGNKFNFQNMIFLFKQEVVNEV